MPFNPIRGAYWVTRAFQCQNQPRRRTSSPARLGSGTGASPSSPVFRGSNGSRAPERLREEVTRTTPEEPAQPYVPVQSIDMPVGACLESVRRLGASNPPSAGTLAANLALGGYEQAVWRRSVRYPGSASGGEPGDGFRGGYNRWVGRKAGVGAPAFVMPRESEVGIRESEVK